MNELGPEAKLLLETARDGDEPTPQNRARVREALSAQLLLAAAAVHMTTSAKSWAAAAAGPSASAAGATGVSIGVAAKAIVSVVLVGAVALGARALVRSTPFASAPPAPSLAAPPVVAAMPPTRAQPQAERWTPISPPAPSPAASEKPAHREASSAVAPGFAAPNAASANDVEAEVRLIEQAHTALMGGDALPALLFLDEHARRFPSGALGEERDATRIVALCALGRTAEARAAATRFLRAYPRSPHAERVRASCGATP